MADANPWTYWQAMLAWRAQPNAKLPTPDFDKNHPEQGYYRGQRNEAVAIWWEGEKCLALVHRPGRTAADPRTVSRYDQADQIGDSVFAYCCRQPVHHDVYKVFVAKGVWPEDIGAGTKSTRKEGDSVPENEPGPEAERIQTPADVQTENVSATPEQKISAEITALIASAEAWLDSIGRKITEQVHADKLANYAVEAQAIEDRAEVLRVAEKRPVDEQAKAIQARWVPLVTAASGLKRNLKTMLTPWLMEQARKAAQEAVDRDRVVQAAEAAGELPPAATAAPTRSVAGTRGRVSLRSRKIYQIDNLREAAEFVAKLNDPPEAFVEGVRSAAELLIKAGVSVPGVSVRTEPGVA